MFLILKTIKANKNIKYPAPDNYINIEKVSTYYYLILSTTLYSKYIFVYLYVCTYMCVCLDVCDIFVRRKMW